MTNNKQEIYAKLGNNTSCYITVKTLADEGYISIDDKNNDTESVIFTKPNTLEYLKAEDTKPDIECIN